VEDSNAPTNPEASTVAAYSAGVGTTALTSGEWYNYASPSFVWGTGVDTAAEGQSASGIDSYLVLLTTDVGATPSSNTGNACYLEAEAESRQFRVGSSPAGCSVSNGTYYLRMQTKDNSGNISAPMTMFIYKYDGSSPSAPTSVSSTTVGYSATNKYTFYWPVASDVGPAGLRGYEYKTGASDGTFSEWQFTTSTTIADVEAYQEGQNFFYVRTVDNAGNYSATTSNLGVAPFYYNASAPSAPLNVVVEPITSSTSPSVSNVFDVSWDKPESYSGEIAKYYYCVNCTPGAGNMTETSSAETVDRRLENVALATQQGKNTFYIVAEDNNVNVTTGYGNRNFEAYAAVDFWAATVAPETPSNLTITDASDRAASKWRLTLAWDVGSTANGATPDHYEIYRSTDNSTFSVIGTVSATAYTDAGLTQSTTYYYKIKAVDNAGSKSLFTSTVNKSPEGRYTSPPSAGGVPTATSGSTTATIKWSTSRSSYGSVEYGETSSYGSAASGASATANHSIKLTGLAPGKTYHYRVLSLDDSALVGYDRTTAYSTDYTFTTLSNPEITDIAVEEVGLDSATISWKTRTMATADLDYGLTTEYGMSKTLSTTEAENSHTVRLTKLDHSSTYHFRIRGKTVDGDNIVSQDQTFSTITYPKINAYVLKTDQQAGGVTVQAVWTTNVMVSSVLEYQVMEIDREEFDKMNFDFEPTADNLSKLSQAVLNRIPVISKGDKQQESKSALATTHSMKIGNLKDGSIYAMTLRGRDKYGNEAVSDPIRYVTGKDTRPPVISGLVVETQVSGSGSNASCSIIVSWETDEPATTQVVYGPGTGSEYNLSTPEEKGLIRRHVVVIRDLQTNTSYHLKVKSADESENLVQSQDLIAVTPATQESALDVVLSNLEDVFGFLKI